MHKTPYSGNCQYIVADIDNTFVATDKRMIPENLEAIREAQAAGIGFAFSTGRCWNSIKKMVRDFGLKAPQVVDNGAVVYDPITEKAINILTMKLETASLLYDGFIDAGFTPTCCTSDNYYNFNPDEETMRQSILHSEPTCLLSSKEELWSIFSRQAVKMGIASGNRVELMKQTVSDLEQKGAALGLEFCAVFTEPTIVVVTPPGVCKLTGIEMAVKHMGLELGQVAAIGDGDNDAQMLECCGLGFAVSNASPAAKDAATHIVASNDEAGFAEAIHTIIRMQNA